MIKKKSNHFLDLSNSDPKHQSYSIGPSFPIGCDQKDPPFPGHKNHTWVKSPLSVVVNFLIPSHLSGKRPSGRTKFILNALKILEFQILLLIISVSILPSLESWEQQKYSQKRWIIWLNDIQRCLGNFMMRTLGEHTIN